ncbi:hypothetical protein EYF80_051108 [Liparis tanakae]|uniref:Uncharacterized protein n=1 Tax=Liparis tanakae TaxID=230148 RepID=A0A4Z2FC10_9TELE|nr:hypothetical protein EYF80_051108 [Liparis tanakae]
MEHVESGEFSRDAPLLFKRIWEKVVKKFIDVCVRSGHTGSAMFAVFLMSCLGTNVSSSLRTRSSLPVRMRALDSSVTSAVRVL